MKTTMSIDVEANDSGGVKSTIMETANTMNHLPKFEEG